MMHSGQIWVQQGVLYEIYIRSFFDRTKDGIGDFRGVSDRLDYVARLGVKGILLNCPFMSFAGNIRHPLIDWMRLDPTMGSLSDFLLILEKAHSVGIKVILSIPINATSDQHVWFRDSKMKGSRSLRKSYFWSDNPPPEPGPGRDRPEVANWSFDPESGRYYWYQDHKDEPALNYGDPELLEEIRRVFEHWLTLDVDGFRLSGSGRLHMFKKNVIEPVDDPFKVFKSVLEPFRKAFSERVFLFEVGNSSRGGHLHDSRLYFHFNSFFPAVLEAIRNEDKGPLEAMWLTGGRDVHARKDWPIHWTLDLRERSEETFEKFEQDDGDDASFPLQPDLPQDRPILSRVARLMENGRRRIQLVMSLFMTSPGIPVLYYGDEIGMGDHPHLWGRNPIRTPMQWSADRNAGFSKVDPEELYNPVIDDPLYSYTMVNVESQERFSDSHLWNVRRMIGIRNGQPALWSWGQFAVVESGHPSIFSFVRMGGGDVCLLIHNLSKSSVCGFLKLERFAGMVPHELIGGAVFPKILKHPYLVTMTPYSFIWFRLVPASREKEGMRKEGSK
ncbi:MAG: alpha-amylase family glycosyl hydrolase [Leptospirales bacterium]